MSINVMYPFTPSWIDYPDNKSLAISIYVMGCEHNCNNCTSKNFKNFKYEKSTEYNLKNLVEDINKELIRYKTNKVVFLGGDPLHNKNIDFIENCIKTLKEKNINVCIYTGYDIDKISNKIKNFDFIKCGTYKEDQKQISEKTDYYLRFASKNQKLYDMNLDLLSNEGTYFFK